MGAVRWCSTRESIEKGEVSVLAIVETLLAVALLVTLSLWLNTIQWLAGAVCIAPLLLLRTEDSTRRGLVWWNVLQKVHWFVHLVAICGFLSIAPVIWLYGWWSILILIFFGGTVVAFVLFPAFLLIRIGATTLSVVRHPIQSCATIPGNWRRIVLATDTATAPEYIPGDDAGPMNIINKWHNENAFEKWLSATAFLGFYPITAAYRWSVKATCLIYLPLIWLVETARFFPASVREALDDYQASDWRRITLPVSALSIAAFLVKWLLVLHWNDFALWWDGNAALRLLKLYVVPQEMPLWQLASALNGGIAIYLWFYARAILRLLAKNRAPAETTVRGVWQTFTVISAALSLYTISCTLLITWEKGRLVENIGRIWHSIGHKLLPLN